MHILWSFRVGKIEMKRIVMCLLGVVMLSGCAPQPKPESDPITQVDFSKADYDQPPSDFKLKIKFWLEQNLKDPDSAKVSEPTPLRKEVSFSDGKPIFGYTTCMGVNSKNSYGGYTGTVGYWFFFYKGEIVRAQNMNEFPGAMIFKGHYVNCS